MPARSKCAWILVMRCLELALSLVILYSSRCPQVHSNFRGSTCPSTRSLRERDMTKDGGRAAQPRSGKRPDAIIANRKHIDCNATEGAQNEHRLVASTILFASFSLITPSVGKSNNSGPWSVLFLFLVHEVDNVFAMNADYASQSHPHPGKFENTFNMLRRHYSAQDA